MGDCSHDGCIAELRPEPRSRIILEDSNHTPRAIKPQISPRKQGVRSISFMLGTVPTTLEAHERDCGGSVKTTAQMSPKVM